MSQAAAAAAAAEAAAAVLSMLKEQLAKAKSPLPSVCACSNAMATAEELLRLQHFNDCTFHSDVQGYHKALSSMLSSRA